MPPSVPVNTPLQVLTGHGGVFIVPSNGRVYARIIGDGNVVTMQINDGTTTSFNTGVALAAGFLFEFEFHMVAGERMTFSGSNRVVVFFADGEA
jgi:hypothetical protein